ncbi:hypothetical protein AAVH_24198, partial [Aphelenchoides avenae]
ASCLPAEVLLNIVHCVDFNTLIALCFTSYTFHSVVQTNAGELAKRRRMDLSIDVNCMILSEGERGLKFRYDARKPFAYVAAMRRVASRVGFHSLTSLCVLNDWRRVPIDRLLYAAPVLRFIEILQFGISDGRSSRIASVDDVNQFAGQFPHLRRLILYALGKPIFDWPAFLRSEGALKLPELVAGLVYNVRANAHSSGPSETDFLRYCFDFSRLADGVGKFVNLTGAVNVSRSFLATCLSRVANADRPMTLQFRMTEDPNLSTDEFSTEQMEQHGRTVTRYKSRKSSVFVYREQGFVTVTNDPSFDPE